MIDWLTFVAPLTHEAGRDGPFWNGVILSTIPDPEQGEAIDWQKLKRMTVPGSYSTEIQVASTTTERGDPAILVSGNPSKWFQGHNVFGHDDPHALCIEMMDRICAGLGITPSPEDRQLWALGHIRLLRVDVTYSWDLGTTPRVRAALRAMDSSAHLKHRGRGHFYGDAITFGKGSRRWSLTAYAKGPELERHPLPFDLAETSLPRFAAGLLRVELRMLSMELEREKMHFAGLWGDNAAEQLHRRKLAGLTLSDAVMLDADLIEALPGRLQVVYQSWRDGHDLRAMLSRRTFYRYRAELLKHGVDIAVRQPREPDPSNVVPLRVVLHARPVTVPDWAVGTPLYFEPRAIVA